MMKNVVLAMFLMMSGTFMAQNKNAKAAIEVDGVCFMCKARIEKAALKTKGVKSADWNVETHQLSLFFDERKTNLDVIQKNIALVGHDTEKYEAPEDAYASIDPCCKYRDPKVIDDHKGNGNHN